MNLLTPYLAAGYPAVAVETHEEERFLSMLVREHGGGDVGAVYMVAATGGLRQGSLDRHGNVSWRIDDPAMAYGTALAKLAKMPGDGVLLVLADWHHIARNAPAYRALKDALPACKAKGFCVILLAPSWSLPTELQHDVPVVQFVLPTRGQLGEALDLVSDSIQEGVRLDGVDRDAVLDAAAGLTLQEAESAFALSFAVSSRIDPRRVEQEKMALVRQSGYLEVTPPVPPESVGGLSLLREYIEQEVLNSWHDDLLRCRGALFLGPAGGTGKSLVSKMVGSILGCPVLRCDIGQLKASHVGESEARMRAALALADAVAPCVLWLDEIEKGVGGFASSAQTDSGVTLGMVGALLTWMQEHTTPVMVVATCNDASKLPPELTRAGRFDERFFVDLPSTVERVEIASIHLARFMSAETPETDGLQAGLATHVAGLADGWTGAEIEQLVKSAARKSRRNITAEVLTAASADIKPISRVRAKETQELRDWGRANLRPANTPETVEAAPTARRRVTNV